MSSGTDFPVTREILKKIPDWVKVFADTLPTPERVQVAGGSFRWEYPVKDAKALQVTKAVRMASGLQGAMHLADLVAGRGSPRMFFHFVRLPRLSGIAGCRSRTIRLGFF
jgi:hypothetical protein